MRGIRLLIIWIVLLPPGLAGCVGGGTGGDLHTRALASAESRVVIAPAKDDHRVLLRALIEARPGDTIVLRAGRYDIDRGLSLDVDDVTLRGQGMDATVLSFSGQDVGAEGLLVTANDFRVEDLAVEDPAGDGIKVDGAVGVTIRRVRVEWTGGPDEDNGAYGLYPVQSRNVLVEDSVVRGASDAGIYVGQSRNIILRRNRVEQNVAGIEIENSFDADIHDNVASGNTGGVLVFNRPNIAMSDGRRVRIFDNEIVANNTRNFAAPGNIVGIVPRGTGIMMLAAHDVEVFGNSFADNRTVHVAILSYIFTGRDFDDLFYDPYADAIFLHDNRFSGGGSAPAGEIGSRFAEVMAGAEEESTPIPDIVWDGYADRDRLDGEFLAPPYRICLGEGEQATFVNLDAGNDFAHPSRDRAPHTCRRDPLPGVVLP